MIFTNLKKIDLAKSVFVAFVVFIFTFIEARQLNPIAWGADKAETMQLTFNLAKHGVFAFNDTKANGALYATNQREPLPIFLWAQSLKLLSEVQTISNDEALKNSPDLIKAKYSNLLFLALLIFSIILLVYELPTDLCNPFVKVVFLFVILMSLKAFGFFGKVNSFANDVHTAAWLCLLMWQFVRYFKSPSRSQLIFIGLVYGLLCLTKATFFYSGLVVFVLTVVCQLVNKINIKSSLLVLLVTLTVTTPWLVRNYVETGQTAISGRGPETFVDRTYEEIYNDKHFVGLWYAYSPDFLKPLATKLTGYGFEDRLKGGRLQYSTRAHLIDHEARKLGDERMAINSHFKAGIWMVHVYDAIYAKVKDPVIAKKEASKVYKQFALKQMFKHPLRHLKHTMIFAWRGIWILNAIDGRTAYEMGQGKQEPLLKQLLPFLGFVSMLGFFVYGLAKRHHLLLMLTIFSVAAYGFNSFFSHNIPRYGDAFLPVWLLAFGFVLLVTIQRIKVWRLSIKQNRALA